MHAVPCWICSLAPLPLPSPPWVQPLNLPKTQHALADGSMAARRPRASPLPHPCTAFCNIAREWMQGAKGKASAYAESAEQVLVRCYQQR